MEIKDLNIELAKKFNCKFDKQPTGSWEWTRVFVLTKDNISLGRFSFKNGKLEAFKYYKPTQYELCSDDEIMLRLNWYVFDNIYISLELYRHWVSLTRVMRRRDIEKKLQWRKANPIFKKIKDQIIKIRRKSIIGKSTYSCLMEMYREYKHNQIDRKMIVK